MLPLQAAVPAPVAGVAWAAASFLAAFIAVYLLGRLVGVPALERTLSARGYRQALVDVGSSVAHVAVLATAVALGFTVAGYGAVLSAVAILGGALALAVGFAAQDIVGNFVAGLFILRDEPFEVGDWIEWSGGTGEVVEVDLRVTRLRTFDNELVTVPNGDLANDPVTNPVASSTLRLRETFGIGYDDDVGRARELLIEAARDHPHLLEEPEPAVRLVEFGDSAVGLESRVWVRDPTAALVARVRSEYAEAVKERFDGAGIDMPYPHTELTGGIDVSAAGSVEGVATADD